MVIGIIMLIITLFIPTISKANMEITGTGTKWTNVTASQAYDLCKGLNATDSVLGTDKLDAHLVLNTDWGAVAYLAISAYGKVTNATGPSVNSHTTTTGNITGVMDMGKTYTFTSAGHETGLASASNAAAYRQSLINDKATKYVELLPASPNVTNTKGMAISETQGWYSSSASYCTAQYPMLYRTGVLGFDVGYDGYYGRPIDIYNLQASYLEQIIL